MWCNHCQQDVPGIVSREDDYFRCPRCGRGFSRAAIGLAPVDEDKADPRADNDSWELNEELAHIGRMLHCGDAADRRSSARKTLARLDPPHDTAASCHLTSRDHRSTPRRPASRASSPVLSTVTWAALSLGTATFVCGGVLLGWSLVADRAELWTLGVPIALGGQVALLIGLILQLDRIFNDSRRAAAKLDDVDGQLHDLKAATTLLRTGHDSPGTAFYAHMASGASPQLLLNDLKGQLDLLATKIGKEHPKSDARDSD